LKKTGLKTGRSYLKNSWRCNRGPSCLRIGFCKSGNSADFQNA